MDGKFKEKPKGGYRPRNIALTLIGVCAIVLVGAYLFMKATVICGCENPAYLTASAIMETNTWVAEQLTATSDKATRSAFLADAAQTRMALASTSLTVTVTSTPTAMSEMDMTFAAIQKTNAAIAVLLTATSDAAGAMILTASAQPTAMPGLTMTMAAIQKTNAVIAVQVTQTTEAANRFLTADAQTKAALASTSLTVTVAPTVCAFFWAHEDSPKDLAALQASFDKAGITGTTISVDAYGEATSCGGFGLMDITPTISIPAVANETPAESGARIEQILKAIQGAGTSKLHKIIIIFQSTGTESVRWSLDWNKALDALNQNVTGAALYESGRGQD